MVRRAGEHLSSTWRSFFGEDTCLQFCV
jgi:hypothetical protein